MEIKRRLTTNGTVETGDISIIGRGESLETCFADAARVMFSLMTDITQVHQLQIITFEFTEDDIEIALVSWLNLLLIKAREHQLIFCDFRLKHEGNLWKATVAGEKWRDSQEGGVAVKGAKPTPLSVKKIDHLWEARCIVDV